MGPCSPLMVSILIDEESFFARNGFLWASSGGMEEHAFDEDPNTMDQRQKGENKKTGQKSGHTVDQGPEETGGCNPVPEANQDTQTQKKKDT